VKALTALLSVAAVLYAAACAALYFGQRALLYFPTPAVAAPGAERISLNSGREVLRIWQIGNGTSRREHAIIYFGGNAEDVAQNIPLFKRIFAHSPVYLVNYRGYGGSTGSPSEAALFADALTVFDYVHTQHSEVSVIGRSLGSGVAVYLASMREIKKMVLVTPYDSIVNVARRHFPMFPVGLLLKDRFESNSRIVALRIPILVILAENDGVIPRANSDALIALLPTSQSNVAIVPGTDHNTVGAPAIYADTLRSFLWKLPAEG
jgi:pimeloyl-ACP methyl ester carboxylesterase